MQMLIIANEYAPYNLYPAFAEGFAAYQAGKIGNRYADGVNAQAYDRGQECAMRVARWIDRNVGSD
jgi:hypothetical protein